MTDQVVALVLLVFVAVGELLKAVFQPVGSFPAAVTVLELSARSALMIILTGRVEHSGNTVPDATPLPGTD